MPKSKLQEIYFGLLMVTAMVYAMVCYNMALNNGGLENWIFPAAFKEFVIEGPIAFLIEYFIVGRLAKKAAFRMVDVKTEHPFKITAAIQLCTVWMMSPAISFVATLLFKHPGKQLISVWLQTVAFNFPMALFWQLFFAGPFIRLVFRKTLQFEKFVISKIISSNERSNENYVNKLTENS